MILQGRQLSQAGEDAVEATHYRAHPPANAVGYVLSQIARLHEVSVKNLVLVEVCFEPNGTFGSLQRYRRCVSGLLQSVPLICTSSLY